MTTDDRPDLEAPRMPHQMKLSIGNPGRLGRPPATALRPDGSKPPSDIRQSLDRLADEMRLGSDAEIVRTLLVSALLPSQPLEVRAAVAISTSLTLGFAELSAALLQNVQNAVRSLAARSLRDDDEQWTFPKAQRREIDREEQGNREQVFLVFDEWLRNSLDEALLARWETWVVRQKHRKDPLPDRSPAAAVVRELLLGALQSPDHKETLRIYAESIGRARKALKSVLPSAGTIRNRLRTALHK